MTQAYLNRQDEAGGNSDYIMTDRQGIIRIIMLGEMIKKIAIFLVFTGSLLIGCRQQPPSSAGLAQAMTYNQLDVVNLNDQGFPADERSTNILINKGNMTYGATSGEKCHIFRFDTSVKKATLLASIEGPNTVLKGMVLDGSTLYVGTMLTRHQLCWEGRKRGGKYEELDANLYQIDTTWKTGHLYRISGIDGDQPAMTDLGIPVQGQGIQTLAMDANRGLIYGLTYPLGKFFIYNIHTGKTETINFGTSNSMVSNHMVGAVKVIKDLTDYTPGEVEFNNKLVAKAMYVMADGILYTSGWDGRIIRYDPSVSNPQDRFKAVATLPSVTARQLWNRLDEIIEHNGKLYMGTSDGYIFRFDPSTNGIENFGKPIRAIEVMGMAFSTLDGKLYGISGGGEEGLSRFWCLDTGKGIFDVDYPAVKVFNRKPMGDMVCLNNGTIVMAETERVANLWVLRPGEKKPDKTDKIIPPSDPRDLGANLKKTDPFVGHKKLEVSVYPIPSAMHGGSGYTAIQADNDGKIYVGGAYYGKFGSLMKLDPRTAQWKLVFRSDELTHEFGRGQGAPGKIHTKLKIGEDGKLYGAMKQGYEFYFDTRPDQGESPEGSRGGYFRSHLFVTDPKTDHTDDLGPGFKQDGTVGFCVDTKRGFVYGMSEPCAEFEVYNLKTKRMWFPGPVFGASSNRYMDIDYASGKVYHKGETTPSGRNFMTVWDPNTFKLSDVEIVEDEGLHYSPSYAVTCGPVGSHKLYGCSGDKLVEMDLNTDSSGKLHVKPLCTIALDGEKQAYLYAIATGPDGRIYWCCNYRGSPSMPMSLFCWDPESRKKTYLGTFSLGGKWIAGQNSGMCFDKQGNMAIHVLYAHPDSAQFKMFKRSAGFKYEDIESQSHYIGYPNHTEGTYYSVYYIKHATRIK